MAAVLTPASFAHVSPDCRWRSPVVAFTNRGWQSFEFASWPLAVRQVASVDWLPRFHDQVPFTEPSLYVLLLATQPDGAQSVAMYRPWPSVRRFTKTLSRTS